jgi:hypothetical protein
MALKRAQQLGLTVCLVGCLISARGQQFLFSGGWSNRLNAGASPVSQHGEIFESRLLTPWQLIFDPSAPIGRRLNAVSFLGPNLDQRETETLYRFLAAKPPSSETNLPGLRVLKNNLLSLLLNQASFPSGLAEVMVEIYHDQGQDAITRDYAVQHLGTCYGCDRREEAKSDSLIRQTLEIAVCEHSSIAGTALLALHRLPVRSDEWKKRIDSLALQLAQSTDFPSPVRVSAIQVCAERNLRVILPTLLRVAQDPMEPVFRLAALNALCQFGDERARPILQRALGETDPLLWEAARTGIKKLDDKSSQVKL